MTIFTKLLSRDKNVAEFNFHITLTKIKFALSILLLWNCNLRIWSTVVLEFIESVNKQFLLDSLPLRILTLINLPKALLYAIFLAEHYFN